MVLFLGLVAVGVLHHSVTSTGAYSQAISAAKSSPEVRRMLGDNINPHIPAIGTTTRIDGEQFTQFSVPIAGSRASGRLYGVANAVHGDWEFSRLWLYTNDGEKVDITPKPLPLKLPSVPAKKIYLVPVDLDPRQSLNWAPSYYKAKLDIDVTVLPAISISSNSKDRFDEPVSADEVLAHLTSGYPEIVSDPANTLIGVTSRDLRAHNYGRSFNENYRYNARFGVVSCARFQPHPVLARWNPEWLNSRLQKMLTKNVAMLYFDLPMSSDYTSMLSGGVLSGNEVDLMSGSVIGAEGQWDPFIDSGDIGVTVYSVPGKPLVWRMLPSREVLPQTSARMFGAGLTTGLFSYSKTDFVFDGPYPLQFTRVYRTQDSQSRPFGIGASDSMDIFLSGQMGVYIDLVFEDGGSIHFVHARPAVGQNGDTYLTANDNGDPFSRARATFGAGGLWTVERRDGWKFYFPYRPRAVGANVTVLTGFSDPAGRKYEMVRNEAGDLLSVTTPAGDWLHFERDPQHRVRSISDSSGHKTTYEYTGAVLTHVTGTDGSEERYTYDDKAEMLAIFVNADPPIFTNTYDISGNITSQTLPDGGQFKYHYTRDPEGRSNVVVPDFITAPNGLSTNIQYEGGGFRQWLPQLQPK